MPRHLREHFCCCELGLWITTVNVCTALVLVVGRQCRRLFRSHALALAGIEIPFTDTTVPAALAQCIIPARTVFWFWTVVELQDAMRLLSSFWAFRCVACCTAYAPLLPAPGVLGQRNRFQAARLHEGSVPDHEAASFLFRPQHGFELLSHSMQLHGSLVGVGSANELVRGLLLNSAYVGFG